VIKTFRDKVSRRLFERERIPRWPAEIQKAALRKLLIIDAAEDLSDLRVPPGNRFEKLSGDRAGTYSIRINDQWR
jgi:proteic killer suppression protein